MDNNGLKSNIDKFYKTKLNGSKYCFHPFTFEIYQGRVEADHAVKEIIWFIPFNPDKDKWNILKSGNIIKDNFEDIKIARLEYINKLINAKKDDIAYGYELMSQSLELKRKLEKIKENIEYPEDSWKHKEESWDCWPK